jgi:hypothetical protein
MKIKDDKAVSLNEKKKEKYQSKTMLAACEEKDWYIISDSHVSFGDS